MKKFITLLLSTVLVVSAFAQKVGSLGITDADCINYAKNFSKICKEVDLKDENFGSKKSDAVKAEAFFEKYGISGPNRVSKVMVINMALGTIYAEKSMDAETAALMKKMGMDPFAEIKKNIDAKDYATVEKNIKVLAPVYEYIAGETADDFAMEEEDDDDIGFDAEAFLADILKPKDDSKEKAAAKAEYDKNLNYGKSLKKAIKTSTKDTGFLYKELDAKRASKYKLIETITEAKLSKFSDAHYLDINYDSDYYHGAIRFSIETTLDVDVQFTDFDDRNSSYPEFKAVDSFKLTATKVEKYSAGDGYYEGELVVYTKEAGPVHMWYKDGEAVLRCGGLGTIKGVHSLPNP